MKLIIAGSRSISDIEIVKTALFQNCIEPCMVSEIVSGGASGVDRLGEGLARIEGIPVKLFIADWDKFGKSAGYRRNCDMAEYADELLAIWDGLSKGTKHMIDIMHKKNKPVYVYQVTIRR